MNKIKLIRIYRDGIDAPDAPLREQEHYFETEHQARASITAQSFRTIMWTDRIVIFDELGVEMVQFCWRHVPGTHTMWFGDDDLPLTT